MDFLTYIKNGIEWLKGSMDNIPGGASSKKLTGFLMFWLTAVLSVVWCFWAYKNNDWTLLVPVLGILVSTGLIAFGINSSEKKNHLFDPKKDEPNDGGENK